MHDSIVVHGRFSTSFFSPGGASHEHRSLPTAPNEASARADTRNGRKFQAGVRPYAADYYVPDYVPADTDLLCAFRIQPAPGVDKIEASAAVAAESSTGTWTEVWSNQLTNIDYYKAKFYKIEDDIAYIAYPMDLFEENSVVNIMSSIVGNVFGFKAVSALRWRTCAFRSRW